MKIMILSDIHGKKTNLELIQEKYKSFGCNKLVVLGDLYAAGFDRKDVDIEAVQKFLESFQKDLICVRGNCDSIFEVEESTFPIMEGYSRITTDTKTLYITHGHLYNKNNWEKGGILIYGHTHVPFILEQENGLFVNPGSISLPRGNFDPSYCIFDEKSFTIYDIYDTILFQKSV